MASEYEKYSGNFTTASDATSSMPKTTEQLEALLTKMAMQYKRQGVGVELCQRYLEGVVDNFIATRMYVINEGHRERVAKIESDYQNAAAEKKNLEHLINQIELKIQETEDEQAHVRALYEDYNPLQNGHLKTQPISVTQDVTGGQEYEE